MKDLEVHHIRQRRDTTAITEQDHVRNLVTVCSECHDAHHAGLIEITPLKQTSDGAVRAVTKTPEATIQKSLRRSKWTNEQIETIREYLRGHPNIPPKRAVFDLGELGIVITVVGLRALREKVGEGAPLPGA